MFPKLTRSKQDESIQILVLAWNLHAVFSSVQKNSVRFPSKSWIQVDSSSFSRVNFGNINIYSLGVRTSREYIFWGAGNNFSKTR